MAENEKQTNKERLKDITDSIERGIQDLFQSDKYAQYLRTMSRFHKYSVNNTMLIYMQKPDATLVAGFNKWRDQFERNVMKGEKGIKIIAPTPFKKKIEEAKLDPAMTKSILALGLPAGFQNAIFAIANLFIQAGVNSFDSLMVKGNSAAANADPLIYDCMAAFYMACASFMSQNYGAGKPDRVKKSYFISLAYSFGVGLALGGGLFLFGRQFLALFTTEGAVIDAGMKRVGVMGFAYCISAFMDCTIAASRGLGKTVVPTVIVVLGSCVFRVIWVYTIFAHFHTIPSLYLLYPCSWTLTAIAEIVYFIHAYKDSMKIFTQPQPAEV